MSVEKMRRAFDLWHLNRLTDHVLAKESQAAALWMGSKEIIWIGWQASRAALLNEQAQEQEEFLAHFADFEQDDTFHG